MCNIVFPVLSGKQKVGSKHFAPEIVPPPSKPWRHPVHKVSKCTSRKCKKKWLCYDRSVGVVVHLQQMLAVRRIRRQ